MNLKDVFRKTVFLYVLVLFCSQNSFSQCFQIESILVDACDGNTNTEGRNEMVRFKVGPAAINTSLMTVNWPSNSWGGLAQNSVTASKVLALNSAITAAGGCGQILEPTGGVLPANATVILVTSYNFDVSSNTFGALTDIIYILFQNSDTANFGHFANFGSGNRTLKINFGGCTDTVIYNRALLINEAGQNAAGDGATVVFTPAGAATYINNGCVAPVQPFTVDASPAAATVCAGNPVNLTGTAQGNQSVMWSAPSGTFSNPNSFTTTFTPAAASAGTVVPVTLIATNSCGATISDVLNVTVSSGTVPDFSVTPLTICSGSTVPTLATTSPNGIVGTWSPAVISNTASGNYVFTPNAGQCASSVTLSVTIANSITPNFNVTPLTICSGSTVPTLATTSPNGIVGTWNPAVISNTTSGNYVFTPNAGQCASSVTLNVTITNSIVPNFDMTPLTICSGSTVPTLNTTSPNGIVGTWNPAVISNTASGNYVFTPNSGQCAASVTLNVTITNSIVPNFNVTPLTICSGSTVPTLATTSPNGIVGTWNPAVISNTASGNYVFMPNAGQCASSVTLNVTITNSITPNFDVTSLTLCSGSTVPTLATTSPNGITGTWNPAVISNTASGNYIFTPNAGQCASSVTLNVTVTNSITPNFNVTPLTICSGSTVPTLATTSPNGIVGTWSPAIISNTSSGNYVFTPNAGQCASSVTLNVTVTNSITPNFNVAPLTFCSGSTVPTLATTSPNGITGTWNPAVISNTASGNYVFTPNAGQCASSVTLNVTITNSITPNFDVTPLSVCSGNSVPTLATTSPNGITGTWNPAVISNTASGNYVFTPNSGQCASSVTLNVTVTNSIAPDFNITPLTICSGSTVPTLATTSPNGIVGTWSPSVISNTASGNYVFTPNAGQCAPSVTLNVTVTNNITPNFDVTPLTICSGSTVPTLATTSPNGIVGTWNPAVISNTASGNYVFTPNAGQCASSVTLNVTVTNSITPNFDVTPLTLCSGSTVPTLATTSPNGIVGTWNPAVISNTASGNYVFTPNAGQCASSVTLNVTVTNSITPNFNVTPLTICSGNSVPTLATTSPNGIVGTWSPAVISNTASGNYVFTPNTGQCASSVTLNVTVTNSITPDFNITPLTICSGSTVPTLNTTSPNGIVGTWSPAIISNTASGNYVFTPNAGQCASSVTLNVIINSASLPAIEGADSVCVSNSTQLTNATPNGIWSSSNTAIATVDSSGNVTGVSSGNVIITYSLGNGSCGTVTKNVRVHALPNPILRDNFLCIDQTGAIVSDVQLNAGLSNSTYTFVWTLNNVALPTTTNTHLATQPGTYQVTATNIVTGCTASASANVSALSIATATASVGRDFDKNQTITVNVTGGSGDFEFQLDNGVPQSSNVFTNIREGEYEITVRDTNGCSFITLWVYALNYPYYFTPNGDGYHDTWNIRGLADQPNATIFIFDRYGKLLKQIRPSLHGGWDGTYNGHNLPSTDYWFKLIYQSREGVQKEFKAHFSMKR